jgi:hypothetical protein
MITAKTMHMFKPDRWPIAAVAFVCLAGFLLPDRNKGGSANAQTPLPPGASVSVRVQVPASMRTPPFDVDRYLRIPAHFNIAVYARISQARFMAVAPNGDLLVSQPSTGRVKLVRPKGAGIQSCPTL